MVTWSAIRSLKNIIGLIMKIHISHALTLVNFAQAKEIMIFNFVQVAMLIILLLLKMVLLAKLMFIIVIQIVLFITISMNTMYINVQKKINVQLNSENY